MIALLGKAASIGIAGLLLLAFIYGISVLVWTWILMLVLGAAGVDWSFHHCLLPWGLIMPLVLG